MNKTPKFDKALAEYFSKLELDEKGGQTRICKLSGKEFYVRAEDIGFYKKIGVPLPTLSPTERWRKLLAYQNTQSLFKVQSAYSGKSIIATYQPETPFKIYEHQIWFSDKWDPLEFGRNWDDKKDFITQFIGLRKDVPRPNLVTNTTNVNSDYTNASTHLKNCYLTFNTMNGENLYYFDCCDGSKDCVTCEGLFNCDSCYACQYLWDSYRCFFCEHSRNCLDSYFLYDCRNCQNCFMSSNLRNKKYYFRNQQLSKDEYEERMKEVNLGDYGELKKYREEFEKLKKDAFHKPDHNFRAVNSVGDYIENSKDCYWSAFIDDCQNNSYILGCLKYKDCHDLVGGAGGELCYEFITISTANNYNVRLSSQIDNSRNIEYSDLCRNCHDIFGCVGLDNKSFCILNKQYGEQEYWETLDKIKSAMLADGAYGEFFSPGLMPVPYRATFAATYDGFRDYENAGRYGYDVAELPVQKSETQGDIVNADTLPPDIKDIGDDILQKIIFDKEHDKYFRLTPYELSFHRRYNLALPREHPLITLQNFRDIYDIRLTFYNRNCKKCGVSIESTYNPERYKNVYCKECYESEVA